ncbi:protein IMPAIRED IN BABA-INDUCED STERILITY 1-like isoform X2 [Magnolia sinica]|uniref:protein IMPAIRED IN BABA-INDUCED STERILITY 1-like isoform X2 n=1 Tax=Magnolia sinica TaxID=86752 RepID=UPI00265A96BE|nr:protein IMPAIRED IN BABA-INDUCED STERILITY 1-like isoform X2 [Magnolia sinica]
MGCVQAKPSMHSPPSGLNKMKTENGYVGRSGIHGRPPKQRYSGKEPARISRHERRNDAAGAAATSIDVRSEDGRVLTREGGKEGGGLSQRMSSSRQSSGGEEIVDGWPKWLTDNIPREALVGLVPKSAESYDKLDKIGQGTYSNVYKARDRDTGKIVALKKVRFDTSESESVRFMAREIMILRKLDHPNVVKLEGLATSRMQYSLYLVFDFMQTDLARIISRPDGYLTEPQVKCYMQQLLLGLQHCHGRGILHRDIKGSNLLIDKNGMLKIADFGLANYFNPNQKRPLTSRVVTLWYRAPELLLGATDYGVGIDLWSAGCLLAEMFAGRPIMPGRTEFFSTSPLACGLSGLPVIYKEEENESTNTYERRRHRTSKQKRRPRNKGTAAVNPKGDSSSSKEEKEKSPTASMHSQEMGSSTGSTSSGVKLGILDGSPAPSLSPIISSLPKRPSHQTECHPWAGKNIQNPPPLLTSSKIKNAGDKEGLLVGRSASTSDLKGRISALNAFND